VSPEEPKAPPPSPIWVPEQRPTVDPIVNLAAVRAMPPSVPTVSLLHPGNRTTPSRDNVYTLIRHSVPEFSRDVKSYSVTGDHLFVEEIASTVAIYLRFGGDSNPWIRLRQGVTYKRKFSKFSLFSPDDQANSQPFYQQFQSTCTLYASEGPLVENGDTLADGFGKSPLILSAVATTTPINVVNNLVGYGTFRNTLGRGGGTLIIQNTDLANTLQLIGYSDFKPSIVSNPGFSIFPGQNLELKLRGASSDAPAPAGAVVSGFFVATLAGTCTYCVLASSYEADQFEPYGRQSGGLSG